MEVRRITNKLLAFVEWMSLPPHNSNLDHCCDALFLHSAFCIAIAHCSSHSWLQVIVVQVRISASIHNTTSPTIKMATLIARATSNCRCRYICRCQASKLSRDVNTTITTTTTTTTNNVMTSSSIWRRHLHPSQTLLYSQRTFGTLAQHALTRPTTLNTMIPSIATMQTSTGPQDGRSPRRACTKPTSQQILGPIRRDG